MISVSDIIKILDQVPIWKALTSLPKRVAELEARVAALEGAKASPTPEPCPLCGAALKTTAVRSHPTWGTFGLKEHTVACLECGHTDTREVDPGKR